MSAQTIERFHPDTGHPKQSGLPRQRTGPSHLALVPPVVPVRRRAVPAPGRHGLELTRRGRTIVVLALLAAVIVLAFAVSGLAGGGAAAAAPTRQPTRTIVVQPGQTLWSIARAVAPAADRGTTIARIVELNSLPSTDVAAGTRLTVPTR